MKGDFTRVTFQPERPYRRVYLQQGRAQLDADYNEQTDISEYLLATLGQDVIGACGASASSFQITVPSPRELHILPGRMYVDGVLCTLEAETNYVQQKDLPGAVLPTGDPLDTTRVPYLVYLDVWERHVTSLEDASLREIALLGSDTCTRTQVVAQVKLLRLSSDVSATTAAAWNAQPDWVALTRSAPGQLTPSLDASGYSSHENQLYRVEIHDVRGSDIYYKWSRDNGAVCGRVTLTADSQLTLDVPPRDDYVAFTSGQWVELIDDATELAGKPGKICLITSTNGLDIGFSVADASLPAPNFQVGQRLTMRRWEGFAKTTVGTSFRLERGINAQLSAGVLRTGDYWLLPAREVSGDIAWPRDTARPYLPLSRPPRGVCHHYARLAKVYLQQNQLSQPVDLRLLFISNTDVIAELNDIKRRLAVLESRLP